MKQVIYKYPLEVTDEQDLMLPQGAQILTIQAQNNQAMLWALVSPDADTEVCKIYCLGTGHPYEGISLEYISTTQFHQGSLVFHWFKNY